MPRFEGRYEIRAPIRRCFDLSLSIDFHVQAFAHTGERAVDGVTSGLIGPGETVTWEARHFGVRQRLTSKITMYDAPHHFRDSMVRGAFKRLDHDHWFTEENGITIMRDVFDFDAPLGPLGRIAEVLFLTRYMRRLIETRNRVLVQALESDEWRAYLE